jgi:hypothetical protein
MTPERMLDKTRPPTEDSVVAFIGQPAGQYWVDLSRYIVETYLLTPEWKYEGARNGWSMYCRKGGRPLCTLSPNSQGFTALVVLGSKEAAEALAMIDQFGPVVRSCLESAHVFHDGRWLFLPVQDAQVTDDIKRLLAIKKNPPKKK